MSRQLRHRICMVAVAVALASLGMTSTAGADDNVVQVTNGTGSIQVMPGSQATIALTTRNESADAASLSIQATDVTEDDNGCTPSEQAAGDVTCGDGGGELGDWLTLRLVRVGGAGEQQLWSGTIADLARGADVLDDVPGSATENLRLVVALPREATNESMSDRVSFSLRWTWTGVLAPATQTTVIGVGQGGGSGSLPGTGAAVSVATLAAIAALLGAGGLLVSAGRRRRSTPGT